MSDATILIVDDEPINLSLLSQLLRPAYTVRATASGEAALRAAGSAPRPDLILLDIHMPGMDGWTVLERLQADPVTQDIPVVFVTSLAGDVDEERGLQLGAQDYLAKPIKPAVLLARVRMQLELKRARDLLRGEKAWLEAEVRRRTADVERAQIVSIRALARLAETRDDESGRHIARTQSYVRELATRLSRLGAWQAQLPPAQVELMWRSAPLHDLGKVGIPDEILLKRGKFTPEEWSTMQSHAELGYIALERAERDEGTGVHEPVGFLALAKDIARYHHERWDGSGYPHGLRGEAIPLAARIMAIADVFDALITRRVYKPAFDPEHTRSIMLQGRGTHFDPGLLDVFMDAYPSFVATAERLRDQNGDAPPLPTPRATPT